jgi:quinol monooxygenase YgiN
MILLRATWQVSEADRERVLASLRLVLEPTRAASGCQACEMFTRFDNANIIMYIEEWSDPAAFNAHLRGETIKVLLSAVELACTMPMLRIHSVAQTQGMEAIASARCPAGPQSGANTGDSRTRIGRRPDWQR